MSTGTIKLTVKSQVYDIDTDSDTMVSENEIPKSIVTGSITLYNPPDHITEFENPYRDKTGRFDWGPFLGRAREQKGTKKREGEKAARTAGERTSELSTLSKVAISIFATGLIIYGGSVLAPIAIGIAQKHAAKKAISKGASPAGSKAIRKTVNPNAKWTSNAGTGGPGAAAKGSSPITKLRLDQLDAPFVEFPGVSRRAPIIEAYQITAANGQKLTMVNANTTGKLLSVEAREQGLNSLAQMYNTYPMKLVDGNSPVLVFTDNAFARLATNTPTGPTPFGFTFLDNSTGIFVNMDTLAPASLGKNFLMPSYRQKGHINYTVIHEYGHKYDANVTNMNSMKSTLWFNPKSRSGLSSYGKSAPYEGYAEAFAEWHVTSGTTTNSSALAYAKHQGWHGTLSPPKFPL